MRTPSPRKSRARTWGNKRTPKAPTTATLALAVANLEKKIKNLKTVLAEMKMYVDELKDDI
jgi:hypothetical protein